MSNTYPVLYSFRRCPYAMRARLALIYSGIKVELREVLLKQKPDAMLNASPKGTVPVLVLPNGQVIDESRDIMLWALHQSDPGNLLCSHSARKQAEISNLIDANDFVFKNHLDKYKYHDRFPEYSQSHYRIQGEATLARLEERLNRSQFLLGASATLADIAIFPFIRQFAHVDKEWFYDSEYKALTGWLEGFLNSSEFQQTMHKFALWTPEATPVHFPARSF